VSEGAAPPDVAAAASAWYREHGRDFLWRRPGMTPWAIYLIEVMAQQTQIERAARVALEWIERWPSPSALAATPPSEILKAWDRLGYPRRALALHRAATAMAAEHGDEVPRDLTALLALPGVGPYTAAAVASFAYGQRVPVVDTDIRRVLARASAGVESPPARARRAAGLRGLAGSDREARGLVMAELRSADRPVGLDELAVVVTDPERLARALSGLLHDGLAVAADGGYALP